MQQWQGTMKSVLNPHRHVRSLGRSLHLKAVNSAECPDSARRAQPVRMPLAVTSYNDTAIMAAFYGIRPKDLTDVQILTLRSNAVSILKQRNKSSPRESTQKVEELRRTAGELIAKILPNITTDRDLLAVTACMSITLPRSEKVWLLFDKEIGSKVGTFSPYCAALVASMLLSASRQSRVAFDRLITPHAVAMLMLNNPIKELSLQKNDHIQGLIDTTPSTSIESTDFKEIHHLGLYLEVITHCKLLKDQDLLKRNIMLEAISTALKSVLSSTSTSTKSVINTTSTKSGLETSLTSTSSNFRLKDLQPIWRAIPYLQLPDLLDIYKLLYCKITESLLLDQSQILNQETLIISLLESMKMSKIIDRNLIKKLLEVAIDRGFNIEKYGVSTFGLLIELDATNEAMKILTCVLDSECMLLPGRTYTLSNDAKLCIFEKLSNTNGKMYRISDLILALYTFGKDKKLGPYYSIIERIEGELCPKIENLKINEVLNIINVYSFASRKYPGILKAANIVIQNNIKELSRLELERILWSNAHLNNRTGYNKIAGELFFTSFPKLPEITSFTFAAMVRVLWSLAVLEELSLEQYYEVDHLVSKYSNTGDGTELSLSTVQMLSQIFVELRIKASKRLTDSTEIPISSEERIRLDNILMKRCFELERTKVVRASNIKSSQTHTDISKQLINMGIAHTNEKLINEIYIVDILTSIKLSPDILGLLIEIDGPSHFENYVNLPLGPTLMKKRHLESFGYVVKNLPYWKYNINDTSVRKQKLLHELIFK